MRAGNWDFTAAVDICHEDFAPQPSALTKRTGHIMPREQESQLKDVFPLWLPRCKEETQDGRWRLKHHLAVLN
jgi:hypothetical protein